jgi:hypothetical protein
MKNRITRRIVSTGGAAGRAFKSLSNTLWICATAGLMFAAAGADGQSTNTNTNTNTNNNTGPVTNSNTPSITAPLATAEYWLTHFSTNTWSGTHGWIQTGAAYENQLQFADAVEVGFKVYSASTNSGLALDDQLLTAGIAGTIVSDELDVAWYYDVHDLQLLAGAGGGYDRSSERVFPGFFAEGQKKTSANTHLYLRAGMQYEGKKTPGMVILGFGGEF